MIKFGIIGFGFMGQTHAQTILDLEFAELVAVCDTNEDQFEFADSVVKTYNNVDDLLANSEVETVIISVPNHLHLLMVEKAAKAGKDIICEKPAAMNATEYQEMLQAVEKAGVRFTVHHQRRWDSDYCTAKKVYDSQTLGEVYTIKSSLYGFNGNMHDWHIYPEYGGGMLYDWGVHLLDQILMMVPGKLKTVYAVMKNVINENVDDYFNIQLTFENGVTAQVELGTYFLNDEPGWFEKKWFLGGDKGGAYVEGFECKGQITRTTELLTNVPGQITMTAAGPTRSFGPPPEGRLITEELPKVNVSHRQFFENYHDAVLGKTTLAVKHDEVLRLMRLVDTIRKSSEIKQSVPFE